MGKLSKKIIIASSIVAIGAIGTMIVKKLYSDEIINKFHVKE